MKTRILVLSGLVLLSLVGCAAAEPVEQQHSAASVETDSPIDSASTVLPECEGFAFDESEQVAGDVVAGCISASIVAQNFGKMTVESDVHDGLSTFRYRPEFAAKVEMAGDDLLFIDGDDMWLKDDLGWVKAVDDNSNFRGKLAFTTASAYRALSDPLAAVGMISSAPLWDNVGDDEIELVNGDTRSAWKLSAAAPFTYLGVEISELSFWVDTDYTVLQQHAVSSALGETATTLNRYYDWGKEAEFIAPVEHG